MKNFFKRFYNESKKEEPSVDNSVLLSAISLMIEVSLADEIKENSENETFNAKICRPVRRVRGGFIAFASVFATISSRVVS